MPAQAVAAGKWPVEGHGLPEPAPGPGEERRTQAATRLRESYRSPRGADRRSYTIDTTEIVGAVSAFESLAIKMVRQSPDEGLWDYLIDRHYGLGSP